MARRDPEKARRYALKRLYGITLEEYNDLLEQQGGGCALCGKTPEEEGQSLAVDHVHEPPYKIRGLLCRYCNHRRIGRHKDADLLRRMADYLERDTGLCAPAPKRKRRRVAKPRTPRKAK